MPSTASGAAPPGSAAYSPCLWLLLSAAPTSMPSDERRRARPGRGDAEDALKPDPWTPTTTASPRPPASLGRMAVASNANSRRAGPTSSVTKAKHDMRGWSREAIRVNGAHVRVGVVFRKRPEIAITCSRALESGRSEVGSKKGRFPVGRRPDYRHSSARDRGALCWTRRLTVLRFKRHALGEGRSTPRLWLTEKRSRLLPREVTDDRDRRSDGGSGWYPAASRLWPCRKRSRLGGGYPNASHLARGRLRG